MLKLVSWSSVFLAIGANLILLVVLGIGLFIVGGLASLIESGPISIIFLLLLLVGLAVFMVSGGFIIGKHAPASKIVPSLVAYNVILAATGLSKGIFAALLSVVFGFAVSYVGAKLSGTRF